MFQILSSFPLYVNYVFAWPLCSRHRCCHHRHKLRHRPSVSDSVSRQLCSVSRRKVVGIVVVVVIAEIVVQVVV